MLIKGKQDTTIYFTLQSPPCIQTSSLCSEQHFCIPLPHFLSKDSLTVLWWFS